MCIRDRVKLNQAGFRLKNKWLVKGVSLQIEQGKIVTLIGPNGSGKTTTAKIALGVGMEVVYCDKYIDSVNIELNLAQNNNVLFKLNSSSLEDLLKQSDLCE